ncbi:MAG: hypothetical protein M3459_02785 [Actinomycetota bacterium]|nr:hypothetical protein [Actinomycetota bacterium]
MRTLSFIASATLAATAVALGAAPAAADTITGPIARPSTADGVLVYSQRDADGQWALHKRDRTGELSVLDVPRSSKPFDVDMGLTTDNQTVALYSRCATLCRIYQLDVDSGTETLVPGVHAVGHSETMPTLHHGVLGFQRRPADEKTGGSYRLIALRPGAGSREVKALRAGQNVTGADLSARGLALSTERQEPGLREVSVQVKPSNRPFRTLHVKASGELSRVTVTAPSWRGNDVYWGHARAGDAPSRQLLRGRVTGQGTDIRQHSPTPNPLDERGVLISGVAVDDVNSELPLWIGVTIYEEGDVERTGLGSYPVGSLQFYDH